MQLLKYLKILTYERLIGSVKFHNEVIFLEKWWTVNKQVQKKVQMERT